MDSVALLTFQLILTWLFAMQAIYRVSAYRRYQARLSTTVSSADQTAMLEMASGPGQRALGRRAVIACVLTAMSLAALLELLSTYPLPVY